MKIEDRAQGASKDGHGHGEQSKIEERQLLEIRRWYTAASAGVVGGLISSGHSAGTMQSTAHDSERNSSRSENSTTVKKGNCDSGFCATQRQGRITVTSLWVVEPRNASLPVQKWPPQVTEAETWRYLENLTSTHVIYWHLLSLMIVRYPLTLRICARITTPERSPTPAQAQVRICK